MHRNSGTLLQSSTGPLCPAQVAHQWGPAVSAESSCPWWHRSDTEVKVKHGFKPNWFHILPYCKYRVSTSGLHLCQTQASLQSLLQYCILELSQVRSGGISTRAREPCIQLRLLFTEVVPPLGWTLCLLATDVTVFGLVFQTAKSGFTTLQYLRWTLSIRDTSKRRCTLGFRSVRVVP